MGNKGFTVFPSTDPGDYTGQVEFIGEYTASGGEITASGVSMSGYSCFLLIGWNIQCNTDSWYLGVQINNEGAIHYTVMDGRDYGGTPMSTSFGAATACWITNTAGNAVAEDVGGVVVWIFKPVSNHVRMTAQTVFNRNDGDIGILNSSCVAQTTGATDVTQVSLLTNTGTIDGGTFYLYGVKDS